MSNVDSPLSLRAIADRIVQLGMAGTRDTNGIHCLLSILKSGRIRAVASFPELFTEPLRIPISYWESLGPGELRSLRRERKKGLNGTYKVRLKSLAAEAYRSVPTCFKEPTADAERVAIQLIQHASRAANVEVLETEWQRFIEEPENFKFYTAQETRGRGRPEKNWEDVYKELAARLWLIIDLANLDGPKHEVLARDVANYLKSARVKRAPKASTIQNRIATVRMRVAQLQEQDKKDE